MVARYTFAVLRPVSPYSGVAVANPKGKLPVSRDRISVSVMVLGWLPVVSCVYVRDVGRGFVKDDFGWIATGQGANRSPCLG